MHFNDIRLNCEKKLKEVFLLQTTKTGIVILRNEFELEFKRIEENLKLVENKWEIVKIHRNLPIEAVCIIVYEHDIIFFNL